MNIRALFIYIIILLAAPTFLFGIDYVWKDAKGGYFYDCGGHVVGGRARVKAEGEGQYRVKGTRINRIIRATSIYHAAQIACGEKPEMDEGMSETAGAEQ